MSEDIIYRKLSLNKSSKPVTLDEDSRSFEITISTDTPIAEFDMRSGAYIDTVIVPDGIEIPENGQVPYVDSHDRFTVDNQLGSVREMRVEGNSLIGRVYYAEDDKSDRAYRLALGGHLTDNSIGAQALEVVYLDEGESGKFSGREYHGPVKVITRSRMIEVSAVAVGADPNAKNRAADFKQPEENKTEVEETKRMSEENKEATVETPVEAVERSVEQVDTEAIERAAAEKAIEVERARVADIEGIARECGLDNEFIAQVKDESVEDFRKRALKAVISKNEEVNVSSPTVERQVDAADKFLRAAEDATMLRIGQGDKIKSAEDKEIAREVAGLDMVTIGRELLRLKGEDSLRMGRDEVISRAIATGDFPILCGNIANKMILSGFESANETYTQWADTSGSLSDFKTHTFARAGEFGDLEEVGEGEEYKYGTRPEQKEEVSLKKYGKLFQITREALINDDLSQLSDTASSMGLAAARLVGDKAYEALTANAAMGDGVALFDAAHGNVGTGGILGTASYGEAVKLMKLQKDIGGKRRLNIQPRFFLAPVAIEGTSEVFFRTERYADADTASTRANIYFDAVQRIYEPRLDDDSQTAWYLLSDPSKTVKLFFLNGAKSPFMEREDEFKRDVINWKIRMEVASKPMHWKSMVYNAGA
jgi:phage major head subunit gpT-like protein